MKREEEGIKEGLTKIEKKVLIGESTFLSFGFVVTIILAVVYTVNIDGKASANARANATIIQKQDRFGQQYLKQMEILNDELKTLNTRLGRIEGKLDSIKR